MGYLTEYLINILSSAYIQQTTKTSQLTLTTCRSCPSRLTGACVRWHTCSSISTRWVADSCNTQAIQATGEGVQQIQILHMHPVFRHIPNVHCIITMCLSVRVFPSETTGCILCVGLQYTTRWYLKIMSPCHKDVTNTGTISTHTIATWRCSLKSVLLGNSYMPTKRCL